MKINFIAAATKAQNILKLIQHKRLAIIISVRCDI